MSRALIYLSLVAMSLVPVSFCDDARCPVLAVAHPGPCEIFVAEDGERSVDIEFLVGTSGFLVGEDGMIVLHIGADAGVMRYEVPPVPKDSFDTYVLCTASDPAVRSNNPAAACGHHDAAAASANAIGSPVLSSRGGDASDAPCDPNRHGIVSIHATVPVGMKDALIRAVGHDGTPIGRPVRVAFGVEESTDRLTSPAAQVRRDSEVRLAEIEAETREADKRADDMSHAYDPHRLHPELLGFDIMNWVQPELAAFLRDPTARAAQALVRRETATGVYSFPLFNDEFSRLLIEEIDHFQQTEVGRNATRPNSMNNYGVALNEIGMRDALSMIMDVVVHPLAYALFPEWSAGGHLDHHHGFVVQYQPDGDRDLDIHMDASEVTVNAALGKTWTGGELLFRGQRGSKFERIENATVRVDPGRALIHVGQHWHQALPITSGERYNLILWTRASERRMSAEQRFYRECGGVDATMHRHGAFRERDPSPIKDEV